MQGQCCIYIIIAQQNMVARNKKVLAKHGMIP